MESNTADLAALSSFLIAIREAHAYFERIYRDASDEKLREKARTMAWALIGVSTAWVDETKDAASFLRAISDMSELYAQGRECPVVRSGRSRSSLKVPALRMVEIIDGQGIGRNETPFLEEQAELLVHLAIWNFHELPASGVSPQLAAQDLWKWASVDTSGRRLEPNALVRKTLSLLGMGKARLQNLFGHQRQARSRQRRHKARARQARQPGPTVM